MNIINIIYFLVTGTVFQGDDFKTFKTAAVILSQFDHWSTTFPVFYYTFIIEYVLIIV